MAKKTCTNTVRIEPVDRISSLPDDVLVRILSFVPTEQAVTTSFLSKRWKSLWTIIPILDFDFARFSKKFNALSLDDQKRRFLDFVEHVFFHYEPKPLQKLRLAFPIAKFNNYISKATLLVKLAMRSNCLTLDLNFVSPGSIMLFPEWYDLYALPPCFFPHQSVSQLNLAGCKFVPSFVQLQRDSVSDLVSKCPCLEELRLLNCTVRSSSFKIIAPESNLKCLVLQSCSGNGGLPFKRASIRIPTLSQLKFDGSLKGYLSISNSENLIKVGIDIFLRSPRALKLVCKLLKDLCNLKSLTLFSGNLQVLNTDGGISLLTPLNSLRHLTVKLKQTDKELLGLICLLRSSPYLETLSVDFAAEDGLEMYNVVDEDVVDEEAVGQLHLLPSDCVAHLMKIKIKNFFGLKFEMEFVELILRSSLCLKEMVVNIKSRYYHLKWRMGKEHYMALKRKKANTIRRLFGCKRASLDAQILVE
ncbi:hypothetical protein MKW94_007900 [Papaver nudicaule]|uniref:F-box domain-containing protein n=1 Tax=Papaver nudicaule TaxID=74823 RepID=A0AA41RXC8_PAPNU|nr:hypothetical protein [Papaver nudicaule]